ncbi:class I SAM-dependent methyltransferase [Cutibacterium avidum]|uniref:class I SAM-dependent methyltransferase n=1 Tax=Cutibacterium avidum TaxID=33010 RepID=UPI00201770BB|nr:class I SAM-dependent methyltransferase [Cutibacterium avidum]MDU3568315.1 class I SAM-dependent methyltransferase [Cutibacterium avidum]
MAQEEDFDAKPRAFYANCSEAGWLRGRHTAGLLELEATRRYLSFIPPEARVLDIGGATGVHASWLAARGLDVVFVDPVPEQVDMVVSLLQTMGRMRELDRTGEIRERLTELSAHMMTVFLGSPGVAGCKSMRLIPVAVRDVLLRILAYCDRRSHSLSWRSSAFRPDLALGRSLERGHGAAVNMLSSGAR